MSVISAGSALNDATTTDPLATDDASKGYSVNSTRYQTTTHVMWRCLDATANAAVWVPMAVDDVPGFIAGRFYATFYGVHATAVAVGAIDTLYAYPFRLAEAVVLTNLDIRVVTGGAGSSWKGAIYASAAGRPIGAPLAVNNTGAATATSNADAPLAMSAALQPGRYWVAQKFTGTPPALKSISSTDYSIEALIGRTQMNGNTSVTGTSVASTYSANMPTFTGAESWTDQFGAGIGIVSLGL